MITNQIIHGDCVEVMATFPDNSVHCIVTDPPYGLSFMGKSWDKALPPVEAFKEMNRVLTPGGLAFVMSSPRQDLMWRMMQLLEESGFELNQSFISWIYKTGFPKAYDISKGIDKKKDLERKVVGKKKLWGHNAGTGSGSFSKNQYEGMTGITRTEPITAPASDEARQWEGWKAQTGLKPALEPILMVNKPFSESTIVDNVLRWGTGAINIDACRIPLTQEEDLVRPQISRENNVAYGKGLGVGVQENPKGRFPANLIVCDKALDTGEQSKSGTLEPHHNIKQDENGKKLNKVYGKFNHMSPEEHPTYGDVGDQSRYFDIDEWAKHHGLLDIPKPSVSERDYGVRGKKQVPKSKFNLNDGQKEERFDGAKLTPRRNIHPTVKPIQLMAYLVALGCPKDGIILDPFVGSGTTCIAAKKLGRKYIGIELEEQYVEIANQRLNAIPFPITQFFGYDGCD